MQEANGGRKKTEEGNLGTYREEIKEHAGRKWKRKEMEEHAGKEEKRKLERQ
jgi:hypothetical protein